MKKSFAEILKALPSYSETRKFESSLDERRKFDIEHLDAAEDFLRSIDEESRRKIERVCKKAGKRIDPKFFKKLTDNIWEFRINHQGIQFRLLAFWGQSNARSLVLSTHGFIKKTQKIPKKELRRAEEIRALHFLKNPK